MNLIDRYVYAVAQYLPMDIREDIKKELRTNIEDMLPENYTEDDVYQVLEELGSPIELADKYNPKKRYLIGPGYYDKYISVLKLVVGICIAVSVSIGAIDLIVNSNKMNIVDIIVQLFTNIITGAFVGALQGAFWVTLIFVILERSGVNPGHLPFYEKWTPDALPEIPLNDQLKISRGETIFSMICTIIFTVILYIKPQLIALYQMGDNDVINSTSLFDIDRLKVYMFFIFGMAILQLGIFVWKFISERWNMPLILCNAIYNVLMCILVVVMLRDTSLFNANFIPAIADITKGSVQIVGTWFQRGKWIFVGGFIAICVWDSIGTYFKYKANK